MAPSPFRARSRPGHREDARTEGSLSRRIDVVEINEAFATQVLACERALGLDRDGLNPQGGAIALGQKRHEFEDYVHRIISEAKRRKLTRSGLHVRLASLYVLSAMNSDPFWFRPTGPMSPESTANEVADLYCHAIFG